jgi:hypothetical protein
MSEPIKKPTPDRRPIPVAKLIMSVDHPGGVMLPSGANGDGEKQMHRIMAGSSGTESTAIEWLPWMRMYRVTRSRMAGTERVPCGSPFLIPETWAVAVLVDDV